MSRHVAESIDVATAEALMDMGDHPRASSQLRGAVALHNILERERIAYLADEVGLGKTYVALATLALYRHFNPDFRALVIAPKKNIQQKWKNDWNAFVRNNWHIIDLRVKGAAGGPAREVILPERLSDLAYESMVDDDRDFICRLPSFSFALFGSHDRIVSAVRRTLPWLSPMDFPGADDFEAMRDFVAQAYNAALPKFDLVIIDEAHNLHGGISIRDGSVEPTSIRNAMLAQVLGHSEVTSLHPPFAKTYAPIADRVLMLSATPIETSYTSLWNQVHLVGKASPPRRRDFSALKSNDERATSDAAGRIMIRRINALHVNGKPLTKNLYRRTWHQGGVSEFDVPLPPGSDRQRLTVALVQKLVADEIGSKFGGQFQMGMLASFESFAETALKPAEPEQVLDASSDELDSGPSNFDESDQAESVFERIGVDTSVVNQLGNSHFKTFGCEMAHPKMDALVHELGNCWERGDKALVFVRRIASVRELKRKLDEKYDAWLFARLERDLPKQVWDQVDRLRGSYLKDKEAAGRNAADGLQGAESDPGGSDTFFSWFFRGDGPTAMDDPAFTIESGASVSNAVYVPAGGAATFFAQHYLSLLLDCTPGDSFQRLCDRVSSDRDSVAAELVRRAAPYLPRSSGRRHQFDAVQLAALELLSDVGSQEASLLLHALGTTPEARPGTVKVDPERQLGVETFFTRLRIFPDLQATLRVPRTSSRARADGRPRNHGDWVREQVFANMLIATAARRGHALIDLYVALMRASGAKPLPPNTTEVSDKAIGNFLAMLEQQRKTEDRSGAFWELSRLLDGNNLELIRSKNLAETEADTFKLSEAPTLLGQRLGAQQPSVGMVRRVNATAVQQFRMPGYPHVLVCTDVLREGEDLHLFCDRVIHYGVAWTPSALEQRSGRVDRLYSLAERRFSDIDTAQRDLEGDEKIQIQVPYLPDTVEVLQTRRVFENMHRFTELMHQNVARETRRVDIDTEILQAVWEPPVVKESLVSAFEVNPERDLTGRHRQPAVSPGAIENWWQRLHAVAVAGEPTDLFQDAKADLELRTIYASRLIPAYAGEAVERVQPYTLKVASRGPLPLVQVMTPVGRMDAHQLDDLRLHASHVLSRITISQDTADREYNVALEGNVVLADPSFDRERIGALIKRATTEADRLELVVTGADLTMPEVERTLRGDMRHDI